MAIKGEGKQTKGVKRKKEEDIRFVEREER